jgi:hypothetical protein
LYVQLLYPHRELKKNCTYIVTEFRFTDFSPTERMVEFKIVEFKGQPVSNSVVCTEAGWFDGRLFNIVILMNPN